MEVPASIRDKTSAALNGDTSAAGVIFEWYRPRLYAHALRICGNTPLAQDAVQDTFIAAFTHLDKLRNAEVFYPWLKKILVNNCLQLLRKEKFVSGHGNDTLRDLHQNTIEDYFEKSSKLQSLYYALQFLSEELRACMLLRYFSRTKGYEEIAVILGIPVGTVRSRLAAGRVQLSQQFFRFSDTGDHALKESGYWNEFYLDTWKHLYNSLDSRSRFFDHFHPAMQLRYTSGKWDNGRKILEKEINNDLHFGSRYMVNNVMSSGNISIIEGPNRNGETTPDRCAPNTIVVVFRENELVHKAHIFDSPR